MAALDNLLDEYFVRRFLIGENNSYKDFHEIIKNRYPNLRGCSLRSLKRFCCNHGIVKRISVADDTVDIAVHGAISEVRECLKSIMKSLWIGIFSLTVGPR